MFMTGGCRARGRAPDLAPPERGHRRGDVAGAGVADTMTSLSHTGAGISPERPTGATRAKLPGAGGDKQQGPGFSVSRGCGSALAILPALPGAVAGWFAIGPAGVSFPLAVSLSVCGRFPCRSGMIERDLDVSSLINSIPGATSVPAERRGSFLAHSSSKQARCNAPALKISPSSTRRSRAPSRQQSIGSGNSFRGAT